MSMNRRGFLAAILGSKVASTVEYPFADSYLNPPRLKAASLLEYRNMLARSQIKPPGVIWFFTADGWVREMCQETAVVKVEGAI